MTGRNMIEKRAHQRFPVEIEAQIVADGFSLIALTKDISRGGICLVCPKNLATGTELFMSISLVLGPDTFSESLELSGRVVWCTPIGQMFQVGASFDRLSKQKREFLDVVIKYVEQESLKRHADPIPPVGKFDTGEN